MVGLIGKKVGMTQVFDNRGELTPVTVIHIDKNTVVGERTEDKDNYSAVIIGAESMKKNRVKKPYAGQFKAVEAPLRHLMEFKEFDQEVAIGDSIGVEVFNDFEYVDVTGITKGKGYQGVVKRYGFGGGRKTHGSKFHRTNGSTGMAAWPSRVIKGTKMAGRMGGEKRTAQNLRIIKVDEEKQIILVKGQVPGRRGGMLVVRTAKKKS
jgi:large subunit ribosomal protein L3